MRPASWLFVLLGLTAMAAAVQPCRIEVVEQGDGWPVPGVELRTVHGVRLVSDNAGLIACDLPELMGRETWFTVSGHGYGVKADGFGYAGVRLTPAPGRTLKVTVARTILASSSAESADPSARHFSELLALIRREGIRVIVTDAGQSDIFARRLAEDAGLPPPLSLSFEYLEPAGRPGDSWTGMMLLNGRRLHEALSSR